MFFDDRLATVLRQRADSDVGLRTQFRQLLDILGARSVSAESARDPSLVATAWMRLDALGDRITSSERARIISEKGWRFHNPELASHLADFEPDVASAALTRADLSAEDWTALIPRLPVRARGFLRLRKDLPGEANILLERLGVHDRGLPSPGESEPPAFDDAPFVLARDLPNDQAQGDDSYVITDSPLPEEVAAHGSPDTESDPLVVDEVATITAEPQEAFEPEEHHPSETNISNKSTGSFDAPDFVEQFPPAPDTPPKPNDPMDEGRSEISALVERIAQFKRTRETAQELDISEPRLPLEEDNARPAKLVKAFGFAADAAGRIEWADSDVASMVIGARLVPPMRLGSAEVVGPLQHCFDRRQPIEEETISLHGADPIAGDWVVTAQPRFTIDGNFCGYSGRFRRPAAGLTGVPSAAEREADRIRQLLHELRTPVTAMQGYAEVIQQQLFGKAPHEYRALAASIAADAAHILAGFEELDRLAKLETGAIDMDDGETDLSALILRTNRQLDQVLHPRMAGIAVTGADDPCIISLDTDETEGLIWRLLATLGGGCTAGETIAASLTRDGEFALLTCDVPAQLLTEDDIFAADAKPVGSTINAGLFGAGFALRLARAEANAGGGDLRRQKDQLLLKLPLLVDDQDLESHEIPPGERFEDWRDG